MVSESRGVYQLVGSRVGYETETVSSDLHAENKLYRVTGVAYHCSLLGSLYRVTGVAYHCSLLGSLWHVTARYTGVSRSAPAYPQHEQSH